MAPDGSTPQTTLCFHCTKAALHPVWGRVFGHTETFCSEACRDVAAQIDAAGLTDYYAHRNAPPEDRSERLRATAFDDDRLVNSFVKDGPAGRSAAFLLEGVSCSACMWLIEQRLHKLDGLVDLRMDQTARQAYVTWDPDQLKVSDILTAVDEIGFTAHPFDATRREALQEEEKRRSVERLLFAGLLMMPVMGFQIATYWLGTEPDGSLPLFQKVGRWFVLAVTIAVLVYSGRDFFAGALRDLRQRRAGMDVPIVLGLGIAWAASVWSTITASGHVYFDSIVMFVFFVLSARIWELSARRRAGAAVDRVLKIMPQEVTRLTADGEERVLVQHLSPGDRIRLSPGEIVPVDARLDGCESHFDEALMTGESEPVARQAGELVISGACNIDQPIQLIIEKSRDDSTLAAMQAMIRRGMSERPAFAMAAERIAPWFVAMVLLVAATTATAWLFIDPSRAVENTVAVLIVTCPCALALATPVALAVAAGRMSDSGILPIHMGQIEALTRIDTIAFDKTGTLTMGHPTLTALHGTDHLGLAAAMERGSEHPISQAICAAATLRGADLPSIGPVRNRLGQGLELQHEDATWRLGSLTFVSEEVPASFREAVNAGLAKGATVVGLSRDGVLEMVLELQDGLRPGASESLRAISNTGRQIAILSGDRPETVARLAADVSIPAEVALGGLKPEDKLVWVKDRQAEAHCIMMVGDGVNDAPVLSAANVSVSLSEATDLARQTADFIILTGEMTALNRLMTLSERATSIIRQNLFWALTYNLTAIPLAALGYIPPWLAAIGMSASSFIVVGNALRLGR
ncbi:heavy metal translocating P-type ATPase metal-binding domain-containing protein [Mesobacterium sp. TK19101]|uniref:Heavy metal translocating P-type ATPase metal-binding domain-containing protein n=1 Tax=Mesobacterium hydrothermale TaxID=3111907 RepID=A0ABU6HMQ6_9RHOB|nr:heavy metal translocating P-type ATPase metal-binding domain-containing protein [Mesobacterium sp. TK19101]MEC3863397.1 heavy metal translocating P-type ATPase metal-binding domain-containing protein [Mesobacterium sp. TK19101]